VGTNPITPMIKDLKYDEVRRLYIDHLYPFDENAINVFGIRNSILAPDKFDDILGIAIPGGKVIAVSGTTDPGRSWLTTDDGNADGCFILMDGFFANCWHRGLHHGIYKGLVQFGSGIFKGYRDNNKDGKLDLTGKIWDNVVGLNFHTTRWDKQVQRVGDFSAGCQVVEVAKEYDKMIETIYQSTQPLYSYALFKN
jgi:hypothetical protein